MFTLQVQIIQCTKKLAIQFKLDCTSSWIFLHFFCVKRVGIAIKLMVSCHQLTEKVYVIQTNEHLWDLVAFTWKKQCGPEPIISNLEMVFFFKKYSDLLREKVVISVTRCWEIVFCYTNCSDLLWEKNVPVIEKYFKKKQCGPESIISTLEMAFCFKKYSDLLWEKVVIGVKKLYFVTQIALTYCEKKKILVIAKYF